MDSSLKNIDTFEAGVKNECDIEASRFLQRFVVLKGTKKYVRSTARLRRYIKCKSHLCRARYTPQLWKKYMGQSYLGSEATKDTAWKKSCSIEQSQCHFLDEFYRL